MGQEGQITYSIDARELLGELQYDGDDNGLTVVGRTEELYHSYFLFLGHFSTLFLHFLDVLKYVLRTTELLEN